MKKNKEEKVPILLRIKAEFYRNVSDIVHFKKKENRDYSINKFVNEAIEEKVKKINRSEKR